MIIFISFIKSLLVGYFTPVNKTEIPGWISYLPLLFQNFFFKGFPSLEMCENVSFLVSDEFSDK
jgi:hypothetical protein